MHDRLCGIYLITNIVSGEHYVGQAVDILTRWKWHRQQIDALRACRASSHGERMRDAIHRDGPAAFRFSVIELCDPAALDEREVAWMFDLRPTLNTCVPDYGLPPSVARLKNRSDSARARQAQRQEEEAQAPRCACGRKRKRENLRCYACGQAHLRDGRSRNKSYSEKFLLT